MVNYCRSHLIKGLFRWAVRLSMVSIKITIAVMLDIVMIFYHAGDKHPSKESLGAFFILVI